MIGSRRWNWKFREKHFWNPKMRTGSLGPRGPTFRSVDPWTHLNRLFLEMFNIWKYCHKYRLADQISIALITAAVLTSPDRQLMTNSGESDRRNVIHKWCVIFHDSLFFQNNPYNMERLNSKKFQNFHFWTWIVIFEGKSQKL